MNIFRIPLNLIVVLILLQDLSLSIIFKSCVLFIALAIVCMFYLKKLLTSKNKEQITFSVINEDPIYPWINEPYDLIVFSKHYNNKNNIN